MYWYKICGSSEHIFRKFDNSNIPYPGGSRIMCTQKRSIIILCNRLGKYIMYVSR